MWHHLPRMMGSSRTGAALARIKPAAPRAENSRMRRALLAVLPLLLILPQPASADTDQLPRLEPAKAQTIVVDARRGRDSNPGTARRPLRTVAAAWERIPRSPALKRPVRVLVRPGRYRRQGAAQLLGEPLGQRAQAPIVIAAATRGHREVRAR